MFSKYKYYYITRPFPVANLSQQTSHYSTNEINSDLPMNISKTHCFFCEMFLSKTPYAAVEDRDRNPDDYSMQCNHCGKEDPYLKYCIAIKNEEVVRQFYYLDECQIHIIVNRCPTMKDIVGSTYFDRGVMRSSYDIGEKLPNQFLWLTPETKLEVIKQFQMIRTFQ
jgi:hypothetical protein